MSPPLLGAEEGQSDVTKVTTSPSSDCLSPDGSGLKERNYLGLSDCSSVDSSAVTGLSEKNRGNLNLKATELRLGLPGSQSPEREPLDEKQLFPLLPLKDGICSQKNVVSGNKRGFSDTMDGNWMFHTVGSDESPQSVGQGTSAMLSSKPSGSVAAAVKEAPPKSLPERPNAVKANGISQTRAPSNAPAAKAQVIGWPPVRAFRRNTLATTSRDNDEVDGKPGPGALFVKVSMDGAPYLRKVDLRNYSKYHELSSALEKMFSGFTIGQCGSNGRESLSESKLKDLLSGSEYVLTYEDKDGDWMLVGDVPWEMFIESCKRLKIMKSSDAIGLAPRGMEKSKTRD